MENAKESQLSFSGFLITHSNIEIKGIVGKNMSINLDASGEINKSDGVFHLGLTVTVNDDLEALKVDVKAESDFKITEGSIDDPSFSNYLFLNAPAILFPYIRAYITSLTGLSGITPIIIPPINIVGLKDKLKEQTAIKE